MTIKKLGQPARGRRYLFSALSILLAASIAGCGGGGSSPAAGSNDTQASVPPPNLGLEAAPVANAGSLPPLAPDEPFVNNRAYSIADDGNVAEHDEGTATTHRRIKIEGKNRTYTAKAGHLLVRDKTTSQPNAAIFYTAYTLDGEETSHRPVTFFFNGGPGSPSSYLKMGSFAPMRVFTLNSSQITGPNDLRFGENPETLLDRSDLVFVDPVGTGHSVAVAPAVNKDFWGVDSDAMSLSAFVTRYLNVNNRRISPVFLFGESYGGPRTSIMSYDLHAHFSVKLSGLILLAPAMNHYEAYTVDTPRRSPAPISGLPVAAMTARHFGLLGADLQAKPLDDFYKEVNDFTNGPLQEYQKKPSERTPELTREMEHRFASYSSSSYANVLSDYDMTFEGAVDYFYGAYFNAADYLTKKLVPNKILGYYDTRKTGAPELATQITDYLVYDPSVNDLDGYGAVHASYLYHDLKYQAASTYWTLGSGAKIHEKWNRKTVYPNGSTLDFPDATIHLAAEMLNNTAMKVLTLAGYYDAVVQPNKIDWDMSSLAVPKSLIDKNYSIMRFEGGHMIYADDKARAQIRQALEGFYRSAVATSVPAMKPQEQD